MTEKHQPVVVGIGEILWDLLPGGKRAGGAPINFVYHAAQMGAEGYVISAVGNDAPGTEILAELKKNGISHFIAAVPYPTGQVSVELNDGIPAYTIHENTAWDYIPLTEAALQVIRRADAVCFGTLASRSPRSRENIMHMLKQAPAAALKFFDINLRGNYYSKELIRQYLRLANVFKLNEEEMAVMRRLFNLEGSDNEVCCQLIRRYQLKYLIFTAGDKYSVVYTPRECSRMITPQVTVSDTVGAGDAFSGAFVYNILTGKTLQEAHRNAVQVSAFVCTKPGAWPPHTPYLKGL